MLAKAVDALSQERSLKHKTESFSKSCMEEKDFLCKIIENNPEGSYFCEESACEICSAIMPKQTAFSLSFAKNARTTKIVETFVHTYPTRNMQLRLCILWSQRYQKIIIKFKRSCILGP